MSLWLGLVLAHLIADFVLQPYELVQLKRRPVGRVIHVLIHGLAMVLLAAPLLPRWWLVIPLVALVHYFVDALKIGHGPERGLLGLGAFLLDQLIHLGILAAAVVLTGLPLRQPVSYGSPAVTGALYYAVPCIAATFAGAILLYQVALTFGTRANPRELLQPGPRVLGMLERLVTLTVVLFLFPWWWWVGAVAPVINLGRNTHHPRRWVETATGLAYAAGLGLLFR